LLVTSATGGEEVLGYDKLVIGTGAVPVRPPIAGLSGPDALGPGDGVHLLHSMGDTFAVMRTLEQASPASAAIVGAGSIGPAMAARRRATGPPCPAPPICPAWSSACGPRLPWQPRRGPCSASGALSRSTPACGPTCPTCSRPPTALSPTTGCSARPTCRWAP